MSKRPTHYLAVSVGPLVSTILTAQQTRELWTASYLFSTLMKYLIIEAQKVGVDVWSPIPPGAYVASSDSLLAPAAAPKTKPDASLFGAGIYPDRMYAAYTLKEGGKDLEALFADIKERAIAQTAKLATAKGVTNATHFYTDFFRIVHVWLTSAQAGNNMLFTLNELLDSQELQPATLSDGHLRNNALIKLLNHPYSAQMVREGLATHPSNVYSDFTAATTRGGANRPPLPLGFDFFPSTAQIASQELFSRHPTDYYYLLTQIAGNVDPRTDTELADWKKKLEVGDLDDKTFTNESIQEFYRQLENGGERPEARLLHPDYHDYHKYFCIVHADGDRFGKVIEGLGNDETDIKKFSGKLANFAAAAAKDINEFGGKPIYIGGDDLVFFAPAVYFKEVTKTNEAGEETKEKRSVTVFDLIARLNDTFKDLCKFTPQPTLSYGVTLSHYKYPLFEARDHSFDALYAAKHLAWKRGDEAGTKNAITFRLIRHAGSYFEGYLDEVLLEEFNNMRAFRNAAGKDFLSSFTFKLRELEPLLDALGQNLTPGRLRNMIDNFFDEPIHGQNRAQLTKLLEFHKSVNALDIEVHDEKKSARNNGYALLRLMAFTLPAKKKHHD